MAKEKQPKLIKALEDYHRLSDQAVILRGTAFVTGRTNNSNFPNMPHSAVDVNTNFGNYAALVALAADGSKTVIAEKNKQRGVVINMLGLDGRYVEIASAGDVSVFLSSGLLVVSTTKTPADAPLTDDPIVGSVTHGALSGSLDVQFKGIPRAICYELQFAALANGVPGNWKIQTVTGTKKPVTISNITPGTTYEFQVRRWESTTGRIGAIPSLARSVSGGFAQWKVLVGK